MLSKILLFALVIGLFSKVVFRAKLRGLGRQLDQVLNTLLVAIALMYIGQGIWLLVR